MSRRDQIAIIAVAILGLLAVWEFRFTLYESRTGRILWMDRLTGMMMRVEEGVLPPIPSPTRPVRPLRDWGRIKLVLHGQPTVSLSTKWQGGQLLYRFSLEPITKQVEDARSQASSAYTVIMRDRDGFPIVEVNVPVGQMTQILDEKGQLTRLQFYGHSPLSLQAYGSISAWDVQWNFWNR